MRYLKYIQKVSKRLLLLVAILSVQIVAVDSQLNNASAQSLFGVVASDGFDADAKRYLDSAGITNQTHRQALNNLVKGLKGNGLWSKMVAIYPMMGSTSSSMQWNLKDPRNLDAAYRLSFLGGGWTFNSTAGAQPNGTSSYANTFVPNNITGSLANLSFGYGSSLNANNRTTFVNELGSRPSAVSNSNEASLFIKLPDVVAISPSQNRSGGTSGGGVFSVTSANTVTDTRGLFVISRTSTTDLSFYQDASLLVQNTSTETNTSGTTQPIYLAALNNAGSPTAYSNRWCIFAFVAQGLSSTEVSNLQTIYDTFRIAIGR